MSSILSYRVSTRVGTVILMSAMSLCVVSVSTSAFTRSIDNLESYQKSELGAIQEATGDDLSNSNIDNWDIYSNTEYGFQVKYPETADQMKEENKKTYSENYTGILAQPLKISFERFMITVWDNPDGLELKKYLASEDFCALDKAFCRSFRSEGEVALVGTVIAERDWFQTINKPQRFFMPSLDSKYVLDFELTNLRYKREFNKILSTLEFMETIDR